MKKKKLIIIFVILYLIIPIKVYADTDLTIMPISTSDWGDSTLLESGGDYLLMDVTYASSTEVLDFLINNKVSKYNLYLSHYHSDHYGNKNKLTIDDKSMDLIEYLMRNQNIGGYKDYKYKIEKIYLPDTKICEVINDSDCINRYSKLSSAAKETGVDVVVLSTGSKFNVGNTTAEVLYLNNDATIFENTNSSIINNSSLVTKFTNGDIKFLTAGDIEFVMEEKLIELGIDISADIFKLNHHGIQYKNEISNTENFVKKVNPKYSYFQFLENNEWDYKYNSISESIENINQYSNIYNSEINGNIKFVIKNNVITPIAEKNIYKIVINYIDKSNNNLLDKREYHFSHNIYNNNIKYHLYDYNKTFEGYNIINQSINQILNTGYLNENITYNVYYEKNINIDNVETEKKEQIDNPKTGINVLYGFGAVLILMSIITYIIIKKHNLFIKKI